MAQKVLVICTGNSCRSQMAEAFLKRDSGEGLEVFSAGADPTPIHPFTIAVLNECGIDTAALRSKSLKEFLGREQFRYVVFVCSQAEENCPAVFPFAFEKLSWPFDDPAVVQGSPQEQMAAFRRVRDQIESKCREWLAERGVPCRNEERVIPQE